MRRNVIAGLVLVGLVGCVEKTRPAGPDAASETAEPELLLGEVSPLTGPEASFGQSTHAGIELALRQINAKGGVKGRRLAVRSADDRGEPEVAAAAMARLIDEDKVALVLGEATSPASTAMAAVAEARQVPMISHAATHPKITEGKRFAFRVCFTDAFQGFVMAKFARETLKLSKVGVLFEPGNEYSAGLAQVFAARFRALGGKVVREERYGPELELERPVASLKAAGPEALYVPGYYSEVAAIARETRRQGLEVPLLGGDGWSSQKLYELAGEAIEGSYYSNHYSTQDPSPRIQEFVAEYRAAYGTEPDSFVALAYDATRVAANALARAKSLSGPDVRDALAQTRGFDGVTGTITIDARQETTKPAVVLKVEKGRSVYQAIVGPEQDRR